MVGAEDIFVLVGKLELFLLYCLFIHIVLSFCKQRGWMTQQMFGLVCHVRPRISSLTRSFMSAS